MAKNKGKRIRLFERYSQNLTLVRPELEEVYACPLCLRYWDVAAAENGTLTLEHIVPKGLGAFRPILTCSDCNNDKGGRALDSQLHRQLEIDNWHDGESTVKIKAILEHSGMKFPAQITIQLVDGSPNPLLHCDLHRAPPDHTAQIVDTMKVSRELNGTISIPAASIPNERCVKVAELKVGYLSMFRQYGYSYILHSSLDLVRQQILDPAGDHLPLTKIVFRLDERDFGDSILKVTHPNEMKAFIVPLRLGKNQRWCSVGVTMPLDSHTYLQWADATACNLKFYIQRFDPRYLDNPVRWIP